MEEMASEKKFVEENQAHATWDDVGAMAHALYMLTKANLCESYMAEMCKPIIERIHALGEVLVAEGEGLA
jgi:hypothetical protein